jgi:hypothetical protein
MHWGESGSIDRVTGSVPGPESLAGGPNKRDESGGETYDAWN